MKPETKLKSAAEDIKEVLRKYEMAGAIALHLPGHGEHVLHLLTPYSCAYQVEDNEIRLHAISQNYPNVEAHAEHIRTTADMLVMLKHLSATNFKNIDLMLDSLKKKFIIESKTESKKQNR